MAKKKSKETEKVALSLRLPVLLYQKLQDLATEQKRSINKQMELIIDEALS